MKEYIAADRLLRIRGLSLFNISYEAGHVARLPRGTPADTLIILLSGRVRCTIPDSPELILTPERVTLFTKEQPRTSYYLTDTRLLSVHIESKSAVFGSPTQFEVSGMNDFSRSCLSLLSAVAAGEGSFDDFAIVSYVYGLLSELSRASMTDIPERFSAVHSAKLAIERDFTRSRPITDYARGAAMSESTFRRAFTEYAGVPPAHYRLELRLEYVKLLVSTGECSLGEAASRAGFNSLSYLCRKFKQRYGCSVSEYLHGK